MADDEKQEPPAFGKDNWLVGANEWMKDSCRWARHVDARISRLEQGHNANTDSIISAFGDLGSAVFIASFALVIGVVSLVGVVILAVLK